MKAPFGRMGGKSKICKKLVELFPQMNTYNCYVELFFGAGSVFFRKPKIEGQLEVINDIDEEIYKIVDGLQNKNKYINDNINRDIIDKEYFHCLKKKDDVISILEKIKWSFFAQGKTLSQGTAIKTNFSIYETRLKDVIIFNKSFEIIIQEYDNPNTFFYLDPPYESKLKKDYKNYITPEQIYNAIKNIKGKFLLSYNDSPNIRNLFQEYNINTITTNYVRTQNIKDRLKIELYITNY